MEEVPDKGSASKNEVKIFRGISEIESLNSFFLFLVGVGGGMERG